jgi:hypothetical protein
MPKPRVSAAGGFAAIAYTLKKGRESGGVFKLYNRMRSRNTCKTCAYGMGGQRRVVPPDELRGNRQEFRVQGTTRIHSSSIVTASSV